MPAAHTRTESVIPSATTSFATMVRIRRFSRSLAAAATAASFWPTFHPQAVALAHREPAAVVRDAQASGESDQNVGLEGGHGPHTGDTNESRMSSGRTSGALPSRTTLEAPRGAEGIRRRLAAGRGGASIEQDDSEVVAVNRDNRSDLDEHASRRVCKRREFWKGDEPYATAVDAHDECSLGGIHHRVHQASDIAAAGERDGAGAAGEAPVPTQDDAIGSSLHHRPFSRERGPGTGQQIPSFPRDGIVEGSKASVLPEDGGELSPGTPEVGKPNDLQFAPELEYDPWEGYQIVAEADPVTSWEILREVRCA